jgi:hypothetical protein
MNVRKMSNDELLETINSLREQVALNGAEADYLKACEKELAKRWGVKL